MLKVGDRLLCKKTDEEIKKNEYYFITLISYTNNYYTIKIIDKTDNSVLIENYWFSNKCSFYYIWNYFYTPQEVRKMKLERLKSINFLVSGRNL